MASSDPDYTNSSQQCLIACLEYLSQNFLTPQTIADVAAGLGKDYNRDQIFRALWNLKKAGWAVETGGGYLVSPDLTKFSDRLRRQLLDFSERYLP